MLRNYEEFWLKCLEAVWESRLDGWHNDAALILTMAIPAITPEHNRFIWSNDSTSLRVDQSGLDRPSLVQFSPTFLLDWIGLIHPLDRTNRVTGLFRHVWSRSGPVQSDLAVGLYYTEPYPRLRSSGRWNYWCQWVGGQFTVNYSALTIRIISQLLKVLRVYCT